jgi:PAS domain S-box-containing protein
MSRAATWTRTRHEVLLLAVSAAAAATTVVALREAAPPSLRYWLATAASLGLAMAGLFAFWFGGAVRRRMLKTLAEEQDGARRLLSAIPDGLLLVRDDRISSVNRALCEQLGFSREELLEKPVPFPFWPPENRHELEAFHRSLAARGDHTAELSLRHKSGDRVRVLLAGRVVPDDDGTDRQLVTVHDVSEIHRRERRLAELAVRDPETALLDERAFEERLGDVVRDALKAGDGVAVVLADVVHPLDGGNALGRPEGLLAFDRLRRIGRAGDLLARTGRQELGWILPDTDANGALEALERWRSELDEVGGLGLTAGLCDLAAAGDALTLYALADRALAVARRRGPGATERQPAVVPSGAAESV